MPQHRFLLAWREHAPYFAAWALAGLLLALVAIAWRQYGPVAGGPHGAPRSYASAVGVAGPSVVNIYAQRIVTESGYSQLQGNPAAQRFLGPSFSPIGPPRQRVEESLGSAVIVRPDGYLLTNNHVVQDKDNIRAVLWDGRTTDARVVAIDPDTDLAVLKIDAEDLPAVRFGAIDSLRIGDVVLAIGNPFGLGQSVTMGIVSALGEQRLNVGIAGYEDLIQTDAAVNTGNSGGALVNAEGELVGINTAMFGRGRGAEGISFAIPAETARAVLEDIVRQGYVTRSWIGVDLAQVDLRHAVTGERRVGLQVQAVAPGSPAAIAELRSGDILIGFRGVPLTSLAQFRSGEANLAPGTEVDIEVVRAGLTFGKRLVLAQKPVAGLRR
ncbi:MAG: trypsin-like peptidase domain-containing protein [Xanthomonadales bacterium]|nr:trypsin-like peptidase domain-containing protein [Xanthomonadales bacterium]